MLEVASFAVLGVLVVLVLAALPRAVPTVGRVARETRRRDRSAARNRDSRRARHGPPSRPPPAPADLEPRPTQLPALEAPTEDELGITRRQLFNRSLFLGLGIGVGGFGAASLGFLWPAKSTSGFGGKITVGSVADAQASFDKKEPFYNASAKTYVVPYPRSALAKARKVAAYTPPIIAGMEAGYVALYQRCVHLGCRVPWCQSSQWFECPCHGSKYSRVGEKRGGPAPRGLDRFTFKLAGTNIVVDTGDLVLGPPIGTDTTGQAAEGAPCV
ncbi:MAG TPA: Rieske 2Fe-2S domain-containing protein [Acidimicrobiia bacterium]|jgi:cytochrome b6-f complex iron-sulfur subunit